MMWYHKYAKTVSMIPKYQRKRDVTVNTVTAILNETDLGWAASPIRPCVANEITVAKSEAALIKQWRFHTENKTQWDRSYSVERLWMHQGKNALTKSVFCVDRKAVMGAWGIKMVCVFKWIRRYTHILHAMYPHDLLWLGRWCKTDQAKMRNGHTSMQLINTEWSNWQDVINHDVHLIERLSFFVFLEPDVTTPVQFHTAMPAGHKC